MIYLILGIIILMGLITAMLMDDSLIFGGRDGSKR